VNGDDGYSDQIVSLTIPAKPEYIALGRLALTGVLRTHAVKQEVVADLKLALTEACSNSIRHAYADGREGFVEIRYELEDDQLAVEISDEGSGFDLGPLAGDTLDLDEGGLGIAIIRAVTDDVEVGPRPGRAGSRLRFMKYLG
jgi:serine/threonine-protein kinase RsbW